MNCLKCNKEIVGRSERAKYCGPHCSKLYLKSQWRKRHAEKQKAYQREYRRAKNGGNRPPRFPAKLREDVCLKCGTVIDLQAAHVKPLWAGGRHNTIITLCRKHHHQFDVALKEFWLKGMEIKQLNTTISL